MDTSSNSKLTPYTVVPRHDSRAQLSFVVVAAIHGRDLIDRRQYEGRVVRECQLLTVVAPAEMSQCGYSRTALWEMPQLPGIARLLSLVPHFGRKTSWTLRIDNLTLGVSTCSMGEKAWDALKTIGYPAPFNGRSGAPNAHLKWTNSPGIAGRFASESVDEFRWSQWAVCLGIRDENELRIVSYAEFRKIYVPADPQT